MKKRREGQSERGGLKERREGWTRDGYSCPGMPAAPKAKRTDASCRGGHTVNGNMEDVAAISSQNGESREGGVMHEHFCFCNYTVVGHQGRTYHYNTEIICSS